MTVLQELGGRIRQARREAGFRNAEQLSVKLGIGVRTMQRWEQGASEPSIEKLIAVAAATGKPLDFFFGDNGEKAA